MRLAVCIALLAGAAFAQDAPKPEQACYKDKGVDEYISELNKLKKKRGTHNPLPNDICIFSMCTHPPEGPSEKEPPPPKPVPAERPKTGAQDDSSSSSRPALEQPPSYDPIAAANDTDVGDYYYKEKNYRAALMRYLDALKAKPGDAAIHLRIGRSFEKLNDALRAYQGYDSAVKLEPAGKSAEEARQGMTRLRGELQKQNLEPAALSSANQPDPAPCLAPPAPQ